jgi:hypothetical protein
MGQSLAESGKQITADYCEDGPEGGDLVNKKMGVFPWQKHIEHNQQQQKTEKQFFQQFASYPQIFYYLN